MDYRIAILWKQPVGFFQCFEPLVPALAADICVGQALISSYRSTVIVNIKGFLFHLVCFADGKLILFGEGV